MICGMNGFSQFSGAFAPTNWNFTTTTIGGDGSVNTSGAPSSIILNGSDNGGGGSNQYEQYSITIPTNGKISFSYSHVNPDLDDAQYVINGVVTQITNVGSGSLSNIAVNAGDVFSFRVTNYDNCCGRGVLTISNFVFTADGAALNFDGANDYVDIGTVIPLNSSYTKEAWIYANASGSNNIISSGSAAFWLAGGKLSAFNNGGAVIQDPSFFPLNQWVHVAVTFNSSTSLLSLYKNGILVNSGISNSGYTNDVIAIGQYGPSSANFFQGSIDEVRLWNVARTQCDIISYMNCEIPGFATGLLANYHFNQGYDAGNNSTVTTLTDDSGNSNTGTLTNFALTGAASNWVAPGGVTTGSITPSSCTLAAALDFDGADDYVMTNSNISHGNNFTYEAWVNPLTAIQWGGIMTTSSLASQSQWVQITLNPAGALRAEIVDDAGNNKWYEGNTSLLGAWHHIAVSFDGTNLLFYVDGNVESTSAISNSTLGTITINSQLNIGAERNHNVFYNGNIDEVRIWNVARTQCQINTYKDSEIPTTANGLIANYHFNQGVIPNSNSTVTMLNDASGNFNNGTLNNFALTGPNSNWVAPGAVVSNFTTTSTSSFCPPAEALNLDGIDDYVDLGTPTNLPVGNSAYTIEAKIKPTVLGVEGIVGWGNYGNTGESNALRLDPSGNIINYWWGPDLVVSASPINLLDGNWHHIAATFDGTTRSIFVDGILKGSDTPGSSHTVPAMNVRIGSTCTICGGEYFNGGIDEVRIWNVGRTQCDVISYMNCEIPSTATGLVANYHFNQGLDGTNNATVTTLTDASGNSNNGTLTNFALTGGATSNWIAPGGVVSGSITPSTCTPAAALKLDGIDDYVNVPTNSNLQFGTGDFTFESWANSSSSALQLVMGSNGGGQDYWLGILNGHAAISISGGTACEGVSLVNDGVWHHISGVRQTGSLFIYVDGVLENTISNINSASPSADFAIGTFGGSGGFNFEGKIDEVRVWNFARTQCDIRTYMNAEIPGSATGLVLNYNFNQGVDAFDNSIVTSLMDASGNVNTGILNNFALTGSTSNWVAPGGVVSGYTTTLAPPTISVTSGVICAGQSFTMTPTGAITYTFSNGSAIATPTADATYSVSGTDANGCMSSVDAISSVTVNALPTIAVNSGAICTGKSFTMTPSGANTYTFQGGSSTVTPTINATYIIDGTDVNGCVGSTVSSITVNALPTISVNSGAICSGQSFTMVPAGASTYTFSNGSAVVTPTVNASYNVTGTDVNGCISSSVAISSVTVNALPMVMASTSNTLLCSGQTATLSVTGATSYTWSTTENTTNIAITPSSTAVYTVSGTDVNGCVNITTLQQNVSLCTGIQSLVSNQQSLISVYPNPTGGMVNIELEILNGTTVNIQILNTLGEILINEFVNTQHSAFNIQHFAAGVYFVKLIENNKQQVIKLIKQ